MAKKPAIRILALDVAFCNTGAVLMERTGERWRVVHTECISTAKESRKRRIYETDDKLLAVVPDGPYVGHLRDMAQLQTGHPGVLTILQAWFTDYKRAQDGRVEILGFEGHSPIH